MSSSRRKRPITGSNSFRISARLWSALAILSVPLAAVLQLRHQGRSWWCDCGRIFLWAGAVCSEHNSQHFLDPYSFTHLLHGVMFCGLLALFARRLSFTRQLFLAVLMESLWEVIENTEFVISRYREATAALGYHGDSIFNSLGDILCCVVGFLIARRLGLRGSALLFLLTEVVLTFWIRDSLLLEIVMLIHPIEALRTWQMCAPMAGQAITGG